MTTLALVTKLWTAVGIRPLALLAPAPLGVGKVESLGPSPPSWASTAFIVIWSGDPLAGHDASESRVAAHWAPINAFFIASWRRNVAQLRKFPSQSVTAHAVLIAAFVVVTTNRVLPAVAS